MELEKYLSEKQKKKKKKRVYLFLLLGCGVLYVVFAGTAWFILRSPLFWVSKVEVTGENTVAPDAVVALLQSAALRDHNFWRSLFGFRNMLLWPSALTDADLAFLPQIASVSISKDYFSHTITAQVTERVPFAIWCRMPKMNAVGNPVGDEICYWFDSAGTAFERTYDTQGNLLVAVHDYSESPLALGGKVLPDPFVGNLLSILSALRAANIQTKEIVLKDLSLQEIDVATYNGPALYFSLRFPATNDAPVLLSLAGKSTFAKLQYVDFRVENRAYYK